MIVSGILSSDCSFGSSGISVWSSCQDPNDLLTEQAEEIVLATLNDGPVVKVRIEDGIIILVEEIEAYVALSDGATASGLGSASWLDCALSWLTLRVSDLDRAI